MASAVIQYPPLEQFKELDVQELCDECYSMRRGPVGETLKSEMINGSYFLQLSDEDINGMFDTLGDKIFVRNMLSHYKTCTSTGTDTSTSTAAAPQSQVSYILSHLPVVYVSQATMKSYCTKDYGEWVNEVVLPEPIQFPTKTRRFLEGKSSKIATGGIKYVQQIIDMYSFMYYIGVIYYQLYIYQ